jgi:Sec-independent protein translocase protein TatA
MEILIIVNIVVIVVNTGLLLYLFVEVMKLKRDFKTNLEMIEKQFETRISELYDIVKFIAKISLKKMKNNEDKPKIVPFKPEDVEKIKEMLNVSNSA